MKSPSEEMDGVNEEELGNTPVSSPEVPFSRLFQSGEPKQYSTKKEKFAARNGTTTPLDYAPPRPPVKSAPPVSRIFPAKRKTIGPVSLSFKWAQSLDSPNYDHRRRENYFTQLFSNPEKIGQGSFGEVFKATCKDDGKEYAIKKSHAQALSAGRKSRTLQELRMYEMLPEHPNFVKFIQGWEEDDILYIKLELCKESLNQYACRNHDISEKDIWTIFADLLFAVRHLHSHNMIHMDIKPENIFISFDGVCKLGDLGLVVQNCRPNSHAEEGDGRYLAVEAINGNPGQFSDIFSLGMTIFELATDLDVPLSGDLWHDLRDSRLPTELTSGLSDVLHNVIQWMLLKDYTARPTVGNILEHPEVYPNIEEREKKYKFQQTIVVKPDMPPLHDLAKELVRLPSEKPKELEGAVGGVSDDEMLNLSMANDSRASDEVDGLIPTCKEVLTKALLPQEPDVFNRHARTEPLRRTHTALTPDGGFQSPVRFTKMPRREPPDHYFGAAAARTAFEDDFEADLNGEALMSSPISQLAEGDRICFPKNLMTLFDAAGQEVDDPDDVAIGPSGMKMEGEAPEEVELGVPEKMVGATQASGDSSPASDIEILGTHDAALACDHEHESELVMDVDELSFNSTKGSGFSREQGKPQGQQ